MQKYCTLRLHGDSDPEVQGHRPFTRDAQRRQHRIGKDAERADRRFVWCDPPTTQSREGLRAVDAVP
eukprot:3435463-Pleurochrysis_carterae.AAC.1